MILDLKTLSKSEIYHAFIQTIVPRPVAWVLTDNGNGEYNLAPFSYFNGISSEPPLIMLSIGKKRDGSPKDTWLNIEKRENFIIHIPSADSAHIVNATSRALAFGESEVKANKIETEHVAGWPLPMVKGIHVAYNCEKFRIIELGESTQALIIGKVKSIFIADSVCHYSASRLIVDMEKLNPLGRLGGDDFCTLGERISIPRPR